MEGCDIQTDKFLSLGADDVVPTGSIQQVYLQNSYGAFTVNTVFFGWIMLRYPEAKYAGSNQDFSKFKEAIVEALDPQQYFQPYGLASRYFDFSDFDLNKIEPSTALVSCTVGTAQSLAEPTATET